MKEAILSERKLVATLRFLATGRIFGDLKFSMRIDTHTMRIIIPETREDTIEGLKIK
jgi:hypothetical protein